MAVAATESVDIEWAETPLASEIDFLAVRAGAEGARRANRLLAPLGLTVRSYSVLALACGPRVPTQRALARFLDLDPSQVVALVDGLEGRGLVTRLVDSRDRRARAVQATDAGRDLCRAAAQATAEAERRSLAALTELERRQLRSILQKVVFSTTSEAADPAEAG